MSFLDEIKTRNIVDEVQKMRDCEGNFICGLCGAEVDIRFISRSGFGVPFSLPIHFCPNCGAEVEAE